jgi:hypothetical protein
MAHAKRQPDTGYRQALGRAPHWPALRRRSARPRRRAARRVRPRGREKRGGLSPPKSRGASGDRVRPPRCERGDGYRRRWFTLAGQKLNGIYRTLNEARCGHASVGDGSPPGFCHLAQAVSTAVGKSAINSVTCLDGLHGPSGAVRARLGGLSFPGRSGRSGLSRVGRPRRLAVVEVPAHVGIDGRVALDVDRREE